MNRPTVQYYCAATLDGYIADANDNLDWLIGYEGSYDAEGAEKPTMAEGGGYQRFYEGVGALVSGSATYEWLLDNQDTWLYPGKPYWVLTSRDLPKPSDDGADVRIIHGEIADLADEMIASAGRKHLWIVGGGDVASQFADANLLDELIVTFVPVVLGAGKQLFARRLPGGPLQLTGTRVSNEGMVELRYEIRHTADTQQPDDQGR